MADLAERQYGVVSRAQLAQIGMGRGAIELRLARGRLHPVQPRVYAVGHRNITARGRWMAGVLSGGPGAVLSHRSAAALWGVRPETGHGVVVTSRRRRTRRRGLRFHCSNLPKDEVTTRAGIPVTTVPRTLFDLAGMVPYRQLERAVNEAEVRRLWDPVSLRDLLARHPRRPGAAAIRTVLAAGAGVTRSELEDRFLDFIQASNLPLPATNLHLQVGGRWIEADCAWRDQRLIVELDGRATHDTIAAFERDRYRDRALVAAGWRVIRVTWRQLHLEPAALARDLRAALALRPVAEGPPRKRRL